MKPITLEGRVAKRNVTSPSARSLVYTRTTQKWFCFRDNYGLLSSLL